jgi:hypothetical protein
MDNTVKNAANIVAFTLLATVATQLTYIGMLEDVGIVEGWPLRSTLWTFEVVAFSAMAVAALVGLARDGERSFLWALIGVSALLNALQAGVGLSMFLPASEAGESFAPLMRTLLMGAFLFYYLAKLLLGVAAVLLGAALIGNASLMVKIIGGLTLISGAAAAVTNLAALPQGMALVFEAGATGTAAALFTALALAMTARRAG